MNSYPKPAIAEEYVNIRARVFELANSTDPDFVASLSAEFIGAAPRMLTELRDALVQGDTERAIRTAHSIKCNCAAFGMANFVASMLEIEIGCKRKDRPPSVDFVALAESFQEAEYQLSVAVQAMLHSL